MWLSVIREQRDEELSYHWWTTHYFKTQWLRTTARFSSGQDFWSCALRGLSGSHGVAVKVLAEATGIRRLKWQTSMVAKLVLITGRDQFLFMSNAPQPTQVCSWRLWDYPRMGELGEIGKVTIMRCVFWLPTMSFVEILTPNVMVFGDGDSGR